MNHTQYFYFKMGWYTIYKIDFNVKLLKSVVSVVTSLCYVEFLHTL